MFDRLDPKVDFVFKRIFGVEENKDVLLDFLNVTLRESEPRPLTDIHILNPYIDKNALHDKQSILDIHARTADGKQVNIEIQLFNRYDIEKRTLYYWSKMYASQLEEGQKYKELKKTITINILNFKFIPNDRYYNLFHLREDHMGLVLTDHIEIHFMELPKLEEQKVRISDKLVKWLLFLKGVDKPEVWEEISMNEPALQKAMDTLEFLSQNEEARRLYEMRQKALHDEASMLDGAREEGRQEGMQKGMQKGIEEGMHKSRIEIAKNLLGIGIDVAKVIEATGLTKDEVQRLKEELMQ
ncbi:Rpn family recombination-promoting nuclease/putative transposase [Paenibacillus sp. HWE-109]|uniref:Rpn family recombination-promoting nuclease/putative transposase n=1 Tax=Paenibacillus sp. HWE-109 TaxID=1306526 RepID=UPI001EDD6F6A|nr:Rpn family recombination-promoting nuclease/putative transposase [Paenibacillus sp. HWE-109]UKS26562.1 Rpn family recombination-promoting nuclease/putative transposase [Paenibacillus sp. HWE-109]